MPLPLVVILGGIYNAIVNKDYEYHFSNGVSTAAAFYTDQALIWLPILLALVKMYREIRLILDDAKDRKLRFGKDYHLKMEDVMKFKLFDKLFNKPRGGEGTGGSGGSDDDTDPKPGDGGIKK